MTSFEVGGMLRGWRFEVGGKRRKDKGERRRDRRWVKG
jgi:hypothetical protein